MALVLGGSLTAQAGSAIATRLFAFVAPPGATALRLLGATAVLALMARGRVRSVPRHAVGALVRLGVASAAMNLCFYLAIDRIPLGPAVTIEFLGPIGVAVAAAHRRRDIAFAGAALLGVFLVGHGELGGAGAAGIGFALAAGALWACYLLFARRVGELGLGLPGLTVALATGAVVTAPLLVAWHPSPPHIGVAVALGLAAGTLSNALCYTLEIAALRRASITVVGVLLATDPGVAALIGGVVLHQPLDVAQVGGILLVMVAGAGVVLGPHLRD
ncbi:MAG: EamA family transporter [Thermoleophilia bacterium]